MLRPTVGIEYECPERCNKEEERCHHLNDDWVEYDVRVGWNGMEYDGILCLDSWWMTNDEALSSCPNVQIIMYRYVTCSIMRAYRMVVYKLQLSRILQLPYRITAWSVFKHIYLWKASNIPFCSVADCIDVLLLLSLALALEWYHIHMKECYGGYAWHTNR